MSVPPKGPTPEAHLDRLERAIEAFAATLATGTLEAPVPACTPWDLRALTWHMGNIHRWARDAMRVGRGAEDAEGGPAERAPLTSWFREGADALVRSLRSSDPAAECWTFGPKPRTFAFWFRRQAHETAMHAWDAARSQGAQGNFELPFALDGIDEVVGMFFPRQVRLQRIGPLSRSLALEPSDAPQTRWVLATDGAGPESTPLASAPATIRGPANALLLLLWARLPLEEAKVVVDGSLEVAREVLSAALTP